MEREVIAYSYEPWKLMELDGEDTKNSEGEMIRLKVSDEGWAHKAEEMDE